MEGNLSGRCFRRDNPIGGHKPKKPTDGHFLFGPGSRFGVFVDPADVVEYLAVGG